MIYEVYQQYRDGSMDVENIFIEDIEPEIDAMIEYVLKFQDDFVMMARQLPCNEFPESFDNLYEYIVALQKYKETNSTTESPSELLERLKPKYPTVQFKKRN